MPNTAAELEELKRAQAKILQSQKLEAIGQLAAGIAHEINTPSQYVTDNIAFLQRAFSKLHEVLVSSRIVVDEARAGAVRSESVEKAATAISKARVDSLLTQIPRAIDQSLEGLKRVASIIAAMKDFSHPSAGEKDPVDLNEAIRSTITVATNEWKYVADMETDFDGAMPPVPCIRDEFNQVILNLVVNAAQAISTATDDGANGKGKICVSTRVVDGWAEVRVSDNGCGIPKKIEARVFEPFFTTKPVGKGTGQGLAIAYSVVVDDHDGQLTFESEEGKGTTFIVRLPLNASRRGASPSSRGER